MNGSFVDVEAAAQRLRGADRDDLAFDRLRQRQLLDAELVDGVHLAGGERGQLVLRVVVQVVDLVEIDLAAPILEVLGLLLQDALVVDGELGELKGPVPIGLLSKGGLKLAVHDRGRIVVHVLRHGEHRLAQVKRDGVVVDALDRAVDHALHHLRRAVVVLLAGIDLFGHGGEGREAGVGGGDGRIHPAREVEDHVVGVEIVAVVPLDALAQMQRPGLQVVGGLPALRQHRMGDVVRGR